ncbi:hypothetical protein J3P71_20690 [Rhizobium leguminosarum]|uniref:hypothetical protein n=1 Tax=Rhizobium leguminosarum TaxID=384 RepID=UPI001441BA9D|nr:hypothetical protein [Rhizobium leguminosarum]MBY5841266.1 hypothetical protein [Rhizobium leguminosarum]NKM80975.1 hypothetical protein [Rhizobium leguminosarum bv. viciae]QSZ07250.1 hypothetical protein J3P71_20690 [Rhizobium leguminosarum]
MSLIETRFRSLVAAQEGKSPLARKSTMFDGYIGRATCEFPQGTESTPFDLFQTTFTVPPAPHKNEGQTIFIFPGVQPARSSKHIAVLQPVLQWGKSATGGSESWTAQTYYIRGTRETGLDVGAYSSRQNVNIGDELNATIRLEEARDVSGIRTYFYSSKLEGIDGTYLGIDAPEPFVQVGLAIEIYAGSSCSSLPNGNEIAMQSIVKSEGATLSPNWQIVAEAMCSFNVTAAESNGIQEILFEYKL